MQYDALFPFQFDETYLKKGNWVFILHQMHRKTQQIHPPKECYQTSSTTCKSFEHFNAFPLTSQCNDEYETQYLFLVQLE